MKISTFVTPVTQNFSKGKSHVKLYVTNNMFMNCHQSCPFYRSFNRYTTENSEKSIVMPKGQQRKIKDAICNIPVKCDQTCNILPRPPERSGIILLKLKRKLEFRGHVYFQAVRPQVIDDNLFWNNCMPLATLELTTSVYYSDTRSITTLDLKDLGPSRYPSYPAHRVHFKLKICVLGTACKLISFWIQVGLFVYTVVEIQQANSRLRHGNHYELSQDGFNLALIAVCSGP